MIELPRARFHALLPAVRALPINHLFARSVLEGCVDGRAWVDDERDPALAHVVHPYGMTLLFGDPGRARAADLASHLDACRQVAHDQWMQATPHALAVLADELLAAEDAGDGQPGGAAVQRYTRANFRFDAARYGRARARAAPLVGATLRPMAPSEFALPDIGVSPWQFWRDASQFLERGGGWCVEAHAEVAAIAFCSFRFDRQLEIGVETRPWHRRRGYAYHAASALIDECLARGLEVVWSCRKENRASYELAQMLGFEPTFEIPYYRLPPVARP